MGSIGKTYGIRTSKEYLSRINGMTPHLNDSRTITYWNIIPLFYSAFHANIGDQSVSITVYLNEKTLARIPDTEYHPFFDQLRRTHS